MRKHTPGPWVASIPQLGEATVRLSDGRHIFTGCDDHDLETIEGNTKLIAAAPALLAALRAIANCREGDCVKYVAKVDTIACEVLAKYGFEL